MTGGEKRDWRRRKGEKPTSRSFLEKRKPGKRDSPNLGKADIFQRWGKRGKVK